MPVRTIPKSYRNVTGQMASKKSSNVLYESTLERDFFTLLEFDSSVINYDTQPVEILWFDSLDNRRTYTPDVLVQYAPQIPVSCNFTNIIYEIKYRDDLRENWSEYRPKFKAAIRYAAKNQMRFKLVTEVEIRTNRMENARFLLPFLNKELDETHEVMILEKLAQMRECSVEDLLVAIFHDKWLRAELIPSVWHLVGSRRIGTDLNLPITMDSKIWMGLPYE
ncbi:TnsA endonuclease N-terminal domain-containing protein [Planctobacterium marinum]|uniref:TnsA endonuclease N-terminal domain-containing protein n=1 Tax=Planctobacterium marinum TaxID=1631968 RepID=UPI001E5DECE4|nr:TnsA endonuclease N-terminal domain-containing protein [Planctobacterium marinum]MCC2606569.1 TnsA endonuclease N-terminal domain-containing protein [Planctobacterium marinum]